MKRPKNPPAQQLVLLAVTARRVRWTDYKAAANDFLPRKKLVSSQVHLGTIRHSIPVVMTDLGPADVDFPSIRSPPIRS